MADDLEAPVPVLLVEDNEIDAEIVRRVFDRSEVAVRLQVARDGEEALDVLYRRPGRGDAEPAPRLVLLDLRLPGLDGRDVLRRMKSDPELCAIPVAVLTGMTGDRSMLECFRLGGNMFFVKPMSGADAAHIVRVAQQYWSLMENLMRKASGP